MSFSRFLRRFLSTRGMLTTESVQDQILSHLNGHGAVNAMHLYTYLNSATQRDMDHRMIDEAAQILVNRRVVRATRSGRPVDPVHAGGDYSLAFPIEEDSSR